MTGDHSQFKPGRHLAEKLPARLARGLPVLLLFAYPLALVVPAGVGVVQRFYFSLPIGILAGLAAAAFLVMGEYRTVNGVADSRTKRFRFAVWTLLGLVILLPLAGDYKSLAEAVRFFAFFSIPLWFAFARRSMLPKRLPLILSGVWLLHSLHLVWEIFTGQPPVGLCGNRNWMVAFSLALAPWVWVAVRQWLARSEIDYGRSFNYRLFANGLRLAIVMITLGALWFGRSRAGWLALAAFPGWALLVRCTPRWTRLTMAGVIVIVGLATAATGPDFLRRLDAEGVRLPMWRSSLSMITEHPWSGVGAGNFRRDFPDFRLPEQMASPKAAPVTEHPHNEIFHLAASLGIPVAVLWALVLLPLVVAARRSRRTPMKAEFVSAFVLVFHGMLDLTLWRQPTALLGLLCLGLLWRPWLRVRVGRPRLFKPSAETKAEGGEGSEGEVRPGQWLVLAIILATALGLGFQQTMFSWHLREGAVAEANGELESAYQSYLRAARLDSSEVQPLAFAGSLALSRLNQPGRGLQILVAAAEREPDFGHLNRDSAKALSRLGEENKALPFYRREAELFPFDPWAQDNLLTSKLINHEYSSGHNQIPRAARARYHRLRQELGMEKSQRLIEEWRFAVAENRTSAALKSARELTEPVIRGGVLPNRQGIVEEAEFSRSPFGHEFTDEDAAYWEWLAAEEKSVGSGDNPFFRLLHQIETVRRQSREAALLVAVEPETKVVAVLEEKAEGLTWHSPGEDDSGFILDSEEKGLSVRAWQEKISGLEYEPDKLRLLIPVSPWDVLERHRVLAMVIREHGELDLLPPPIPPSLRKHYWREELLPTVKEEDWPEIELLPWAPPAIGT